MVNIGRSIQRDLLRSIPSEVSFILEDIPAKSGSVFPHVFEQVSFAVFGPVRQGVIEVSRWVVVNEWMSNHPRRKNKR